MGHLNLSCTLRFVWSEVFKNDDAFLAYLVNYSDENEFCNFTHKKFHKISSLNLVIGSSKYKQMMIFPFL